MESAAVLWREGETSLYLRDTAEITRYLDGRDGPVLWLPDTFAPDSVVSLRGVTAADWTPYGTDEYEIAGRRLTHLSLYWPSGTRNLRIVGDVGYADGEAPADLQLAVMDMVDAMWNRRGQAGVASTSLEGFSISFMTPGKRPDSVSSVLNKYGVHPYG
jgi:hypothetical protein